MSTFADSFTIYAKYVYANINRTKIHFAIDSSGRTSNFDTVRTVNWNSVIISISCFMGLTKEYNKSKYTDYYKLNPSPPLHRMGAHIAASFLSIYVISAAIETVNYFIDREDSSINTNKKRR